MRSVLPLASLISEVILLEAICCTNKVVVVQIMLHACIPSFTSLRSEEVI